MYREGGPRQLRLAKEGDVPGGVCPRGQEGRDQETGGDCKGGVGQQMGQWVGQWAGQGAEQMQAWSTCS